MYAYSPTPISHDQVERMVIAAAAGDHRAWNDLVRHYTPLVQRVARRHRLAAADADDVVQATWMKIFRSIGKLRDPERFAGWLHRTAQREALRAVGAARRHQAVDIDKFDAPAPEEACPVEAAERRAAVTRALERLTPRQLSLVGLLLAEEPRSYQEIACELDMPIGAIGPTRARLFDRLRRDPGLATLAAGRY